MSAPIPSVPSTTGFDHVDGAAYPTPLFMLDRGLWAIVPRQRPVEVHAVHQQPIVGSERLEPRAGIAIGDALGNVDVHADTEVGGQIGGIIQRLVAAGERGVHTDHPAATGAQDTARSPARPRAGFGRAVTIGHAVGAADAHAHLGARVGDDRQAAVDRRRALVVVDDPRRTARQRLGRTEHRRPSDHLLVEGDVEAPPDLLEDLDEVGRCRGGAGMPRANAE